MNCNIHYSIRIMTDSEILVDLLDGKETFGHTITGTLTRGCDNDYCSNKSCCYYECSFEQSGYKIQGSLKLPMCIDISISAMTLDCSPLQFSTEVCIGCKICKKCIVSGSFMNLFDSVSVYYCWKHAMSEMAKHVFQSIE